MSKSLLGIEDKDLVTLGKENTIAGVLQDFGNKLQADLRKNLQKEITSITPKTLEQSIIFDIKFLGTNYQFELKMEDYWEFVDKGVQGVGGVSKSGLFSYVKKNNTSPFSFKKNGKKPPISALEPWAYNNGVNPFVVQNSVFYRGIRATNFYSDVVDNKLAEDLVNRLEEVGAKEITISLKKAFDGDSN